MRSAVEDFWDEFCRTVPSVDPNTPYQVWYFGNSPEMAAELAALVVSGRKTGTASLAQTNAIKPDEASILSGLSVVTDFHGTPVCVIETISIVETPFAEVDADFAAAEGEGDLSLEYWRRVHRDYFEREAAQYGFSFDDDSIVCCERFRLLYHR